ncbi:MAG: hypothetical protein M0D54_21220 [Hyphomonadaceae bacterium JAD_PAG50586_4]|nr:MAG: hypothetical protein M0D54_21220 [Hyphomonadaceae bacterium JAD_PAG50586_4]
MTDTPEAPPETPKRRRRRWWAYAAGGVFVGAGVVAAIGPGAGWMVEHLADGQRVWRLGRIEISGVSGGWLGDLRAAHITIADEDGVWIEARDVDLQWRPQDIAFGAVRLDAARASSITIFRQPALLEQRPSSGVSFDVRIGDLDIDTLNIEEAVLGQAATFTVAFSLDYRDQSLDGLELDLRRTDSDVDHITAIYHPDLNYALNVDARGAPGGIFARALGVPDQSIRATALGDGDAQTGEATFAAHIGETQLLAGTARWTPAQWSTEAQARLDTLPSLETIAERIGANVSLQASGARLGEFTAHAETNYLALDLQGVLDAERQLVGPAQFVLASAQLSNVARESPFELGAARLEGELRRARGTTAIQGTLAADGLEAFGQRTALRGPISASLSPERFHLEGDLRAPARTAPIFTRARLRTEMSFDRRRGRYELSRADLTSDALDLHAQGWANQGDGEFAGEWRVNTMTAFSREMLGQIGGAGVHSPRTSTTRTAGLSPFRAQARTSAARRASYRNSWARRHDSTRACAARMAASLSRTHV